MNCWICLHHHRHGCDVYPIFQEAEPTTAQLIKVVGKVSTWEPWEEEWVEAAGPFSVPPASKQELGDAYSKGWDSCEGAVLNDLGIRDLECQGIQLIVKDLVRRCDGYKAWRTSFKRDSLEIKQARAAGWKRRKKS